VAVEVGGGVAGSTALTRIFGSALAYMRVITLSAVFEDGWIFAADAALRAAQQGE
jgi:hypothetical protein